VPAFRLTASGSNPASASRSMNLAMSRHSLPSAVLTLISQIETELTWTAEASSIARRAADESIGSSPITQSRMLVSSSSLTPKTALEGVEDSVGQRRIAIRLDMDLALHQANRILAGLPSSSGTSLASGVPDLAMTKLSPLLARDGALTNPGQEVVAAGSSASWCSRR
jgi:hypothetical protein